MRKVFPLNLGGSDTCYFCKKRVYVMERLSAEGHFFHRECFRCSVCASTLRLAAYAFDSDEGTSSGGRGWHCYVTWALGTLGCPTLGHPRNAVSSGALFREPGDSIRKTGPLCAGRGSRERL